MFLLRETNVFSVSTSGVRDFQVFAFPLKFVVRTSHLIVSKIVCTLRYLSRLCCIRGNNYDNSLIKSFGVIDFT